MIDNTVNLKDFVERHNLMDNYSNIRFNALVSIRTAFNKILNQEMEVMITFDGYLNYGTITLLGSNIDTGLFPIQFLAQYQKMEHVDINHLLISAVHKMNNKIGEYSVKIIPLQKRN